jgi:hypothetical protein
MTSSDGVATRRRMFPSAGGSSGSGSLWTRPDSSAVLAGVADAGAARPSRRHVAGFREFEQAGVG